MLDEKVNSCSPHIDLLGALIQTNHDAGMTDSHQSGPSGHRCERQRCSTIELLHAIPNVCSDHLEGQNISCQQCGLTFEDDFLFARRSGDVIQQFSAVSVSSKENKKPLRAEDAYGQQAALLAALAVEDGVPEVKALEMASFALYRVALEQGRSLLDDVKKSIPKEPTLKPLFEILENLRTVVSRTLAHIPGVMEVLSWMASQVHHWKNLASRVLSCLITFGRLAGKISAMVFDQLVDPVNAAIDYLFPVMQDSLRIKAAWGLSGLFRDPASTKLALLLQEAELMQYRGTSTYEQDFDNWVQVLKQHHDDEDRDDIGGPQVRETHVPKRPVMSLQEAQALEMVDTANIEDYLTERNRRYLEMGTKQGADPIYLTVRHPEMLSRSIARYHHDGPSSTLDAQSRGFAREIAAAMVRKYPEQFLDAKPVPIEAIQRYHKKKFSPGSPFIGIYETRDQVFKAGWGTAMLRKAYDDIKKGTYPVPMYHAFPKSQVVDIEAVLRGKDIRTVVAENIGCYYIDQVAQFERNKRIMWDHTYVGSGMPLNQNMKLIFDALKDSPFKVAADCTAYDSTIPLFGFEVLAQLAALGFKDHPSGAVLTSIMRCHYDALGDAWIKIVPTGEIVHKTRGGGTGQSATTADNTFSLRGLLCAAWCDYYNYQRSPDDFFRSCVLANTGDDTVTGFDDPSMDLDRLSMSCAKYGLTITFEHAEKLEDLVYLGNSVRPPNAHDLAALQLWAAKAPLSKKSGFYSMSSPDIPDLVVYRQTQSLLLRRTGMRHYSADYQRFLPAAIQRTVGHGWLTAFNPDLYGLLLEEYVEDAKRYVGSQLAPYITIAQSDTEILPSVSFGNPNIPNLKPSRRERFRILKKKWKFPEYSRVIEAHMKPRPVRVSAHDRKYQKLFKDLGAFDTPIRMFLDDAHSALMSIPREFVRLEGVADFLYPEPIFTTRNKVVEKMIYAHNQPDSFETFDALVRQSPWAAACDSYSFWLMIIDEDFRQRTMNQREAFFGLTLFATVLYAAQWEIEAFLRGVPLLGIFVSLTLMFSVSIPRIFGLMNHFYWLLCGRSSPIISGLMPKDPYAYTKRITVTTIDSLPNWVGIPFGVILTFLAPIGRWMEMACKFLTRVSDFGAEGTSGQFTSDVNEWSPYVPDLLDRNKPWPTINARTGTGKSSFLPGAILMQRHYHNVHRVVHVVPRRVLRDTITIPYNFTTQVLKRDVALKPLTDHVVGTYGHIRHRLHELDADDTVWLFDECHEQSADMLLLARSITKGHVILLSATPASLPGFITRMVFPDVKGLGFSVEVTQTEGNPVSMFQQLASEHPEAAHRAAIIVPTLKEVDSTLNQLRYLGVQCSEMSSRNRIPDITGVVVATQMIDAGYDAKPPFTAIIDSGKELVVDKGRMRIQPSRPQTMLQRQGRAGRLQDGFVYRPSFAGTGPQVVTYPTAPYFANKFLAQYYKVPQLLPVKDPTIPTEPWFRIPGEGPERASMLLLWLFHMQGLQATQLEERYRTYLRNRVFTEDEEFLERVFHKLPNRTELLPTFEAISSFYSNGIHVHLEGCLKEQAVTCLLPREGTWQLVPDRIYNPRPRKVTRAAVEPAKEAGIFSEPAYLQAVTAL